MAVLMRRSVLYTIAKPQTFHTKLLSTLSDNSYIKVFENFPVAGRHVLTLLDSWPPNMDVAIGTSNSLPPTPQSFHENARFRKILDEVIAEHGHKDEYLQMQARAFVGPGGTTLMTGMQQGHDRDRRQNQAEQEATVAKKTFGGHIHLSDMRNPPEFGRIAWPEDILGSVEVSSEGEIIGSVEPSGTYRILTNQGILGVSPHIMERLIEKLRAAEGHCH